MALKAWVEEDKILLTVTGDRSQSIRGEGRGIRGLIFTTASATDENNNVTIPPTTVYQPEPDENATIMADENVWSRSWRATSDIVRRTHEWVALTQEAAENKAVENEQPEELQDSFEWEAREDKREVGSFLLSRMSTEVVAVTWEPVGVIYRLTEEGWVIGGPAIEL